MAAPIAMSTLFAIATGTWHQSPQLQYYDTFLDPDQSSILQLNDDCLRLIADYLVTDPLSLEQFALSCRRLLNSATLALNRFRFNQWHWGALYVELFKSAHCQNKRVEPIGVCQLLQEILRSDEVFLPHIFSVQLCLGRQEVHLPIKRDDQHNIDIQNARQNIQEMRNTLFNLAVLAGGKVQARLIQRRIVESFNPQEDDSLTMAAPLSLIPLFSNLRQLRILISPCNQNSYELTEALKLVFGYAGHGCQTPQLRRLCDVQVVWKVYQYGTTNEFETVHCQVLLEPRISYSAPKHDHEFVNNHGVWTLQHPPERMTIIDRATKILVIKSFLMSAREVKSLTISFDPWNDNVWTSRRLRKILSWLALSQFWMTLEQLSLLVATSHRREMCRMLPPFSFSYFPNLTSLRMHVLLLIQDSKAFFMSYPDNVYGRSMAMRKGAKHPSSFSITELSSILPNCIQVVQLDFGPYMDAQHKVLRGLADGGFQDLRAFKYTGTTALSHKVCSELRAAGVEVEYVR